MKKVLILTAILLAAFSVQKADAQVYYRAFNPYGNNMKVVYLSWPNCFSDTACPVNYVHMWVEAIDYSGNWTILADYDNTNFYMLCDFLEISFYPNWGLYQRYECYWEISTKSGQYKFNDYTFDVYGNVTGVDSGVW